MHRHVISKGGINTDMRALEFLKEYTNLQTAQQDIIATVSGLSVANERDAELIDRIYKVLNNDGMKEKIAKAFSAPVKDENFNLAPLLQKITQLIFHVDTDYQRLDAFLKKLEKGNVVDINVIKTPGVGNINSFFAGDETASKIFKALAEVGAGKKQKGPGEYALAMLSNKIQLRDSEGDLDVTGFGKLEVKAETTTGGGRLGEGGPSNPVAKKYWSVLPSIKTHLETNKGLGLGNFVRYLAIDLPLTDAEKKKERQDLLTNWYSQVFADPSGIVQAFMQDDPVVAESMYGRANFESYKANYGWDGLLAINFNTGKYGMCVSGNDFVKLKEAKHFGSFSISVIPSAARPSEVYAQLSMTKAKV